MGWVVGGLLAGIEATKQASVSAFGLAGFSASVLDDSISITAFSGKTRRVRGINKKSGFLCVLGSNPVVHGVVERGGLFGVHGLVYWVRH